MRAADSADGNEFRLRRQETRRTRGSRRAACPPLERPLADVELVRRVARLEVEPPVGAARLVVRHADTAGVEHAFACDDPVELHVRVPHTTVSWSTSAKSGATRSSGVSSVKISSSFRAVAWQWKTPSCTSEGGSRMRNSIVASSRRVRTHSIISGGASPFRLRSSSRSVLPRSQSARLPSERSRSTVCCGNGPKATSPPTTMVASSGTSASTASSAGRLPCTS